MKNQGNTRRSNKGPKVIDRGGRWDIRGLNNEQIQAFYRGVTVAREKHNRGS